MKSKRVIGRVPFLLAFSGFISTFAQNPAPRQQPMSPQQPLPPRQASADQDHIRTYAGRITKSNGKYVLQDLSSAFSYALDNQKTAARYAGKVVLVTGVLDSNTNMIHVQKIDKAA